MLTRCLCLLIIAFLPAVLCLYARADDAAQPHVGILEKDGHWLINPGPKPPYVDELAKLGLMVDLAGEPSREPLTWKRLKRYNLLVMTSFCETHGRHVYDEDELGQLLDRFLDSGGGILFIGNRLMTSPDAHVRFNRWIEKYGAQFEWATVEDAEHHYTPPDLPFQRDDVIWTTNIEEHPITRDIERLYFRTTVFYFPSLRPLKVGRDWQVLARTMPSAKAWDLDVPSKAGHPEKIEGTQRQGAMPIIACAQAGKGRIALIGHNPGPLWYDIGEPAMGQVCAKNGDGEHPSDWLPFLRNLCVWLSEPARKAGFPGGTAKKADFVFRPDWGSRLPINWYRPDISWTDEEMTRLFAVHSPTWSVSDWRRMAAGEYKPCKFLVGALTARTGGKGTVADWKRAAKAAGYDGIAFRERILQMSKAEWEAFEAECRAATDDSFIALPGQEFTDWEDNTFMRFNWDIPYPDPARLTQDGKRVWRQLHFFFDARHSAICGLPANFPLRVKGNPTPWWSYRVYDALPVAVYQDGKRIEDNTEQWTKLVDRIEFTSPMAVHILDDPAQVAGAADKFNLYLLAPSLTDIRENPRWKKRAVGIGNPNNASSFVSNGPVIEAFLPMAMNRTTLGAPGLIGTYRWRLIVRARSEAPIERVEIWGGGRLLRRYRPGAKTFYREIDDLHDYQRGVWMRVVDARGREALTTSTNMHDKMLYLQWCGDHCNMLPNSMGVDENGDPAIAGIGTHVKLMFRPAGGPGAPHGAAQSYIPYGTDTSSPTLGVSGALTFHTTKGRIPEPHQNLLSELHLFYGNRNALITRLDVRQFADRRQYLAADAPKKYNSGYISGWGAYVKHEPLESLEITHDDIDFQRDADEPGFQLVRATVRFKQDMTLAERKPFNLDLGRSNWLANVEAWYVNGRVLGPGEKFAGALGKGGYFTIPNILGHGTLIALDDNFAVRAQVRENAGSAFFYGYDLGARTFKKGDEMTYSYLIMRWPVGVPLEARLDGKISRILGLRGEPGVALKASRGKAEHVGFGFRAETQDGAFAGVIDKADIPLELPVRVIGLNPNWAAGVWRDGQELLAPIAPDPDGVSWITVNPAKQPGPFWVGNVLTCENPDVLLRIFKRPDGGWDILAHNPTEETLSITVRGNTGGPVSDVERELTLQAGAEQVFVCEPAR